MSFINIQRFLAGYTWWQVLLQLLLIGVMVYWTLRFLRGTRGARLLQGIAFVLVVLYLIVKIVAKGLHLEAIEYLYRLFLGVASVAVIAFGQVEPHIPVRPCE